VAWAVIRNLGLHRSRTPVVVSTTVCRCSAGNLLNAQNC